MGDLFSIFNPSTSLLNINLGWLSSLFGLLILRGSFWISKGRVFTVIKLISNYLIKEIEISLNLVCSPFISNWLIGSFLILGIINVAGLLPYVFTSSAHLSFTLSMALPLWIGVISRSIVFDLRAFLAHLVPLGTPIVLIPLIVLIEIVRNIIRPITLSVRLAANIVAGHLLITLVTSGLPGSRLIILIVILIPLIALFVLETAVALIQSYVFITLSSLYIGESNRIINL